MYFIPFKPGKVFLLIRIIFHSQAARRSLRSSVLRRLMARPCCYWKKTISWAPWTSNWGLHWKSSPASVCSKTRSLSFFGDWTHPKLLHWFLFISHYGYESRRLWMVAQSPRNLKDKTFPYSFLRCEEGMMHRLVSLAHDPYRGTISLIQYKHKHQGIRVNV